jgi:hypothetical protein
MRQVGRLTQWKDDQGYGFITPNDGGSLVFVNLGFTIVVALFALTLNRRRRTSQRALFIHAWHLRQLVPTVRAWATQPR